MFLSIVALSFIFLGSALGDNNSSPENSDRIINGKQGSISEYPYQVSLQNYDFHFCGGSVLNEKWVLTAAHCLEKRQKTGEVDGLTVRMGSSDWMKGGVVRKVEKFYSHPKYDAVSTINDVALLKLASPVVFSASIKAIDLADKQPADGTACVVSGWGQLDSQIPVMSHTLQWAPVVFRSREACASSKFNYGSEILPTMVCAEGEGTDSCQGDSGGPLVDQKSNKLVGVVSWGTDCGKKGYPGVYANVAEFKPWILSVMKAN